MSAASIQAHFANSISHTVLKNQYGGALGSATPRFLLAYWSTRCLAAPLRMLLSAAQVNHWSVMYHVEETSSEPGSWDKKTWTQDKKWLQQEHPFINLPYLVDCHQEAENSSVVSQTHAIALYLGRELNLLGKTSREMSQCEELLFEISDVRDNLINFAYGTDQTTCQADAKDLLEGARRYFDRLESYLKNKYPHATKRPIPNDAKSLDSADFLRNSVVHLVGNDFSVPDFFLWEVLDQYEGLCRRFNFPNCFGDATTYSKQVANKLTSTSDEKPSTVAYPYLKEFHDCFSKLPENRAYISQYGLGDDGNERENAIKLPYNNPYARFGSCPDPTQIYTRGQDAPWRKKGVIEAVYK